MHTLNRPTAQRGFTILEALIALLVLAFGILALAGMQIMLSHNADVSKQRSEATRLAQERMERLRAFDGIGTGTITWAGLPGAAENVTTNSTYTVAAALGGVVTDAMRSASVTVSWTDRTGVAQQVMLNSVISQTDLSTIGDAVNPLPLNQAIKRVKNRNINIPIPAIDLGGGKSASPFTSGSIVVYSNTTGGVVTICTPLVALLNPTAAQINGLLNDLITPQCQDVTGYIVAGYVGRLNSSDVSDAVFNSLGINHDQVTRNLGSAFAIQCQFSNAVNQNDGVTVIPNFKYYLCVIPLSAPVDPTQPPTWSGRIRIGGVPIAGYSVCRYQYTQTNLTVNERNVQNYAAVDRSIDEQNYWITTTTDANYCTDTSNSSDNDESRLNTTGVSVGVLHQDCRNGTLLTVVANLANCPLVSLL